MYNATLYLNTGFNAINIPDSVTLLDNHASQITVPALDIYQVRELSSFVIKANYATIRNADYLKLVNTEDATDFAFYSIQNITMTSFDTALLHVTMDYILSTVGIGGVGVLQFTDGICERHHVPLSDDTFGKYDEDDPYLSPAEMMKVEQVIPTFSGDDGSYITLIESTVDLGEMYTHAQTVGKLDGMDYESGAGNIVCVPQIKSVGISPIVWMENGSVSNYETRLPNVAFYKAQDNGVIPTWIPVALSYVRSLGIESCILAQYNIPSFMVDAPTSSPGGGPAYVNTLTGKRKTVSLSGLPFEHPYYGVSVHNNRLFYGENVKYNIVSLASGNSASFLPEEIYDGNGSPTIEMRVDPRPDGCPYFRFETYRGIAGSDLFFTNAVKGLNWQNAPLVYEGASGSLLNQYAYGAKMTQAYEDANFQYKTAQLQNQQGNLNATANTIGSLMSGIGYGVGGQYGAMVGAVADAASNEMNRSFMNAQYELSQKHAETSFEIQRQSELKSLLIRNNVVAPSMNFPISEGIRDFVGNNCIVYRTYYTNTDVQRIDKILTMYGYKHTVPIETSFLTNRSKFNYIQAAGVAIKNTGIPKWLRDGVASQFAVGTRIWHVMPDTGAYTDGTNT